MIEKLASREVQTFIRENENADPFELSLKYKTLFDLPVELIANQITARKKAKTKLPEWYETEGIILPPLLSMEQCSSEITAKNKASIVSGKSLIDLTGGAGVDSYYLSKAFDQVIYVEQNPKLCQLATHNFKLLRADNILVIKDQAEKFINTYNKKADAIYIDPARRDENKNKVYQWSDCQPDLPTLQKKLFEIAPKILAKASPMLDIKASLKELDKVSEVYIVSVKNECKEVLYLQTADLSDTPKIITQDFHMGEENKFEFTSAEEVNARASFREPLNFLYEPNAAVLKAGAFNILCERFKVFKLHLHSHLYTSEKLISSFPGRMFSIKAISTLNKKALLKNLPKQKANITVRNFPQDVAAIRKKTGIKPGGEVYLFGTTLADGKKVILVCERVIKNW